MILRNCRLIPELCEGFEGRSADIRIEGDTIAEILPAGGSYEDEEVIECEGKTVLPGLYNLHMHLFMKGDEFGRDRVRNQHEITILGIRYMQELLAYGFTFLRDVGSQFDIGINLRNDINAGRITGPTMQACGYVVTPDHIVSAQFGDLLGSYSSSVGESVNGPYEVRAAVRRQLAKGADFIKIMGCSVQAPCKRGDGTLFYEDESEELYKTAKREGSYVSVHTNDPVSLDAAIDSEAYTIEHAHFMTPQHVERIKQHGCRSYVIPTLQVTWAWGEDVCRMHCAGIRYAYEAGLTLGFGTDAGEDVFMADPAGEFIARNKICGMTPLDMLKQATINSAVITKTDAERGSVKVGKKADFAIFNGNPDEDLNLFGTPCAYVLRNGVVVAQDGKVKIV